MIVALIPARAGSERIPSKNLRKLNDIPLVAWSIATALACPSIDKVLVSSESTPILEVAEKFGGEPLSRPPSLAGPLVEDHPVINHCFLVHPGIDMIVYLRPTTPLRSSELVEQAIKMMSQAAVMSDKIVTGLRSVHKMPESAFKCFRITNSLLEPFTREGFDQSDKPDQEVEPTYKANGYVDLALPATVAAGSAWGDTVIPLITPELTELDKPRDWARLEYELKMENAGELHEFYREGGPLKTSWGI